METLLIVLGAAAALGGLAWLAYVGSVMRGPRTNALIGGISSVVVGVAVIILGASTSDDSDPFQGVAQNGSSFVTPTPEVEPTATPVITPEEQYRSDSNELATRVGSDLTRLIQLLSQPNSANAVWVNEVRQISAGFSRHAARGDELVATEDQAELHESLVTVLADLKTAGRQVIDSLDAIEFQNVAAAQEVLLEAMETFRLSSETVLSIVTQTDEEED